jgi:hypothetical protein
MTIGFIDLDWPARMTLSSAIPTPFVTFPEQAIVTGTTQLLIYIGDGWCWS